MNILNVTSSTFFGGPERQMLGLATALAPEIRSVFLSFAEGGRCRAFVDEARRQGFESHELSQDTPHFRRACGHLAEFLVRHRCDVLLCHGYKAGLIGRIAARRSKIPVVAVSRGWTYESARVRLYELLDRINLRWMDRVVCVSHGQAAKVRKAGVAQRKILVIPNAIDSARFAPPDPAARAELERLFPRPVRLIVGAAGRLSPEKGFLDLIDAAAMVSGRDPEVGFVLFGEGVLRPDPAERINEWRLSDKFLLAGFRPDLDRLLPALDLLVQSSYTEGMPNVILEACAAGVPVVATAVGGTQEILGNDLASQLVPAENPHALGGRIQETLADDARRRDLGTRGQRNVRERFTFTAQAQLYRKLFGELIGATEPGSEGLSLASESRKPLAGAVER